MGGYQSRLRDFETYLYVDRKLKRSNAKQYRLMADLLFSYYQKHGQTRESFNRFISSLQDRGRRNGTLNNYIALAKHYDKFTGKNVLTDLKYFKQEGFHTEPLTTEEIRKLAECDRRYGKKHAYLKRMYRVLIYFLALTGCRIQEALSLEKNSVKATSVVFLDTKNGESRQVPIPAWLSEEIVDIAPDNPYAFPSMWGSHLNERGVIYELKKRAALTGLKKACYPHVFRHSLVIELIRQGVNVLIIAKLVGHKSIQSTNRYAALVLDDLTEAQMRHPLLASRSTFDTVVKLFKKGIEFAKMVTACRIKVTETTNSFAIFLKRV